ncbi:ABC transporter substrate-binding protein [Sporichthya polymorpha]|uniref:ABC transporter substrate-binding protein n=1 Tax=Sporichthya polymorpha TaxID=35751 RepID=UPI00037308CD|nr:ABC transporter substrate-binding protein [Sporichthya polymorpha]
MPGGGTARTGQTGQTGQTDAKSGGAAQKPAAVACNPAVNGQPIKIGGTFPLSGPVGFLGKAELAAIDTYAKWFNSRGGYCGRKMEIIALDDGMEPTRQLANMRKLNEEYKVLAASTILTVGVGDYVTRANLPVISLGGAMEQFGAEQPTVFPALGSAYQFTGAFIRGLLNNKTIAKGDRVALMYDTEIFNLAPVKDDLAEQWRKAGMEVVSVDAFNLSNLDCTALLNKMRSLNIDYWDFQSFGWTLCVAAASRIGYKPNKAWGGWTASSAGIPELAGRAADGVWHGGAVRLDPEYVKLMKLYHPAESRTEADLAAPPAIGAWALMGELEKALRAGDGNLTRDQLVKSLQGVTNLTFMGKPVKVNFRPDCKGGTVPSPGSSFTMIQWKYDASTDRFKRAPMGGEIGVNPYIGPCDAAKLATDKY